MPDAGTQTDLFFDFRFLNHETCNAVSGAYGLTKRVRCPFRLALPCFSSA